MANMAILPSPNPFNLPPELYIGILSHLDYASSVALSQANRYLRSTLPVELPITLQQKQQFIFAAETWPTYRDLFACRSCVKLRPRNAFADKQLGLEHAKNYEGGNGRFCINCGVRDKIYNASQIIKVDGFKRRFCSRCSKLQGSDIVHPLCEECEPNIRQLLQNTHLSEASNI